MEGGERKLCPPQEPVKPFVSILEDGFGFITDENGKKHIVRRYTFTNQNNLTVQIISYGAAITAIKCPDKNGVIDDVVLGFDSIEGYLSKVNPYFGAVVGRCANRIAKGHFKINGKDYQLSTNRGENHLHGGFKGFDKVLWQSDVQGNKLVLSYMSQDGEEGYPGEVLVSATYELTSDNELILEMKATTSKPTPINLTNHSYFNLAGHAAGALGLYDHMFAINADKVTETDDNSIPTGSLKNVAGTLWDFRIPRRIGDSIFHVPFGGYDQNLCISKSCGEDKTFVARVVHPGTGRFLEIYANQPGVQLYTSNYFPQNEDSDEGFQNLQGPEKRAECPLRRCPICGYLIKPRDFEKPPDDDHFAEENLSGIDTSLIGNSNNFSKVMKLIGKDEVCYYKHSAFSLATQCYPDSVHRKNFPNSIVKPGETYHHIVIYKFGVYEQKEPAGEEKKSTESASEWPGERAEDKQNKSVSGKSDSGKSDDFLSAKLEENGR